MELTKDSLFSLENNTTDNDNKIETKIIEKTNVNTQINDSKHETLMKSVTSIEDFQKQNKDQPQLMSTKSNMIVIKQNENRKSFSSSNGAGQNNNYNNTNGVKNRGMDALINSQTKKIADRAETLW